MPTAPRYPIQPHTVDDYQRWEGDWELIQGIAVAMGPSPFGPHERMVDDIADGIKLQLRRQKCDCRVPYYLIAEPGQENFQLFINADGQEREALELAADDARTIVLSDSCELTIGPALLQADDYS